MLLSPIHSTATVLVTCQWIPDQVSINHLKRPPLPLRGTYNLCRVSSFVYWHSHRLTLSGLLNALDGVSAQEGRILIATTNKYSALDPALCRPGRMDLHIEFKLASKYQARELFIRFYLPSQSEDDTAAKTWTDSDDNSACNSSKPVDSKYPEGTLSFVGQRHCCRSPKLSLQEINDLANQFAEAIPEREFSMASLQGYLMTRKDRPIEAVQDAGGWVEKERQERKRTEDVN